MKPYLSETDGKDELVRIRAESMELICLGFQHGNLEMPDNVVPLSKALQRMDEFSKDVTEHWDLDGQMVHFNVYACKDGFHLLSYMNGKIWEDHRNDERPKNPDKVYFVMRDGGGEKPCTVSSMQEAYAEFAIRDMEKVFESFDIDKTRRSWNNANLQRENIYFDVYKHGPLWEHGYLYSYKDGKKYIRPLTEKEQEEERKWKERTVVMIRGYGDIAYPTICTYQVKVYEDEAIGVIEQYLDSLPEDGEYRRERYTFEVRTGDDKRHLFRYSDGKVYDDKRGVRIPAGI